MSKRELLKDLQAHGYSNINIDHMKKYELCNLVKTHHQCREILDEFNKLVEIHQSDDVKKNLIMSAYNTTTVSLKPIFPELVFEKMDEEGVLPIEGIHTYPIAMKLTHDFESEIDNM